MSDCGAACLASIAKHHDVVVPIARIRQHAQTDKHGTSVLGLIRASEHLGFSAKGVRGVPEQLPRAPMPCIAHLKLENGWQHFVVVEHADGERVLVMDPADGQHRKVRRSEFDAQWTGVLLLMTRTNAPVPTGSVESRGTRAWKLMRAHRAVLVQALLGTLVYTVLGLGLSIYVQQVVDSVLSDGRAGALRVMTIAMIGITLAQAVIGSLRSVLMLNVGQHVDAALILGYYNHLLRLPQDFFDRMRVGELTSRVGDAVKIRAFVSDVLVDTAANVLVVITAAALMLAYDWRLAAWTLALLPVFGTLYFIGARMGRTQQRALLKQGAALESQLVESLSTIGTVKRFGLERSAELKTEARFVQLFRTVGESARTSIWLGNAGTLASRLGVIGLLYIGATRALTQELSAGQLMSCYALFSFLTGPVLSLVGFSRALEEARAAGERLFEILELDAESNPTPVVLTADRSHDVHFEHVIFRYGGRSAALTDVSFSCPAGSVTAIVGESGSGKSTIASLVQRLYSPDQGRILIGSHDIAHVDLPSLRRGVGVVPQAIDLFAGTVLENLVLSDPAPDIERLVAICEQIGLRDTIERMPQGWMTPVGERGITLSGGERQRLAIVRALYRQPRVLILDEATSALDWANERRIVEAMHELADSGTTVIVIAHRLTTIQRAQHIVVLEGGRVVEQGGHKDLEDAGGSYARMWDSQHPRPRRGLAAAV